MLRVGGERRRLLLVSLALTSLCLLYLVRSVAHRISDDTEDRKRRPADSEGVLILDTDGSLVWEELNPHKMGDYQLM
jgi:hypothetical protein